VALLRAIAAPPRGRQRAAPCSLRAALAVAGPWTMERLARECPPGLSDGQTRALAQFIRLYTAMPSLHARPPWRRMHSASSAIWGANGAWLWRSIHWD